jgi:hypothetical protein
MPLHWLSLVQKPALQVPVAGSQVSPEAQLLQVTPPLPLAWVVTQTPFLQQPLQLLGPQG